MRRGIALPPEDTSFTLDAARLSWEDFASYHAIITHARGKLPALAEREGALASVLASRLARSGASLDLKSEAGFGGAMAQLARARLIDNLLVRPPSGELTPESRRLASEIARAHALSTSSVREPGTFWSVWGLLASRRFQEAFAPGRGEVGWTLETASGKKHAGTLAVGDAKPNSERRGRPSLEERAKEESVRFPAGVGDVTLSLHPKVAARGTGAGDTTNGTVHLFTHARTEAPLDAPAHRGFTARCDWSRTGTFKEGEVVTLSYSLRSQAPHTSWVVFELPLPPGSQILTIRDGEGNGGGGRGGDERGNTPAFVEKGALAVRAWFDGFTGKEAAGAIEVRLGVKGSFRMPGCHAESVREPDVSSTLPGRAFTVE